MFLGWWVWFSVVSMCGMVDCILMDICVILVFMSVCVMVGVMVLGFVLMVILVFLVSLNVVVVVLSMCVRLFVGRRVGVLLLKNIVFIGCRVFVLLSIWCVSVILEIRVFVQFFCLVLCSLVDVQVLKLQQLQCMVQNGMCRQVENGMCVLMGRLVGSWLFDGVGLFRGSGFVIRVGLCIVGRLFGGSV